jgi:hypothetical protein
MAQILKLKKKVSKVKGSGSGKIIIQSIELKKYAGKEVVVRIATN